MPNRIKILRSIVLLSPVKLSHSFSTTSRTKLTQFQQQSKINTNNVSFLQAIISDKEDGDGDPAVITKTTINDRLLAEVQREVDKTKGIGEGRGPVSVSVSESESGSDTSKKYAFQYGPAKTEEERLAALREAQNLNGVDPWSTILSSFFALGMAFGIWTFTQYLGEVFASHPITTDVYFLQRIQGVFRNMIMGLFSLMSGFFGVNGLGILFLGLRVAYGVLNGELDPTLDNNKAAQAKKLADKNVNFSNVWDFMTMDKRNINKKKNIFDDL